MLVTDRAGPTLEGILATTSPLRSGTQSGRAAPLTGTRVCVCACIDARCWQVSTCRTGDRTSRRERLTVASSSAWPVGGPCPGLWDADAHRLCGSPGSSVRSSHSCQYNENRTDLLILTLLLVVVTATVWSLFLSKSHFLPPVKCARSGVWPQRQVRSSTIWIKFVIHGRKKYREFSP